MRVDIHPAYRVLNEPFRITFMAAPGVPMAGMSVAGTIMSVMIVTVGVSVGMPVVNVAHR